LRPHRSQRPRPSCQHQRLAQPRTEFRSMTLKEYLQTASVRQYAMIGGSVIATIVYVWAISIVQHFLDGKVYNPAQFYDLSKMQLQIIATFGYIAGFAMILFVVSLTLT